MSLDLTLVIPRRGWEEKYPLGYERLWLDQDYDLFNSIKACGVVSFRAGRTLLWYGDKGIEERDCDPYGDRLTSTHADFVWHAMIKHRLTIKNRAVMIYLSALPKDTEIILWWD